MMGAGLSPAAARMRLHRERRRRGMRCLRIEIRETEIDAFVSMGLIEAEARNDTTPSVKVCMGSSTVYYAQLSDAKQHVTRNGLIVGKKRHLLKRTGFPFVWSR